MRPFPVAGMDGATGRLLEVCQALQLSGDVPKETAAALVGRAKAVRGFCRVGETTRALKIAQTLPSELEHNSDAEMVQRYVDSLARLVR